CFRPRRRPPPRRRTGRRPRARNVGTRERPPSLGFRYPLGRKRPRVIKSLILPGCNILEHFFQLRLLLGQRGQLVLDKLVVGLFAGVSLTVVGRSLVDLKLHRFNELQFGQDVEQALRRRRRVIWRRRLVLVVLGLLNGLLQGLDHLLERGDHVFLNVLRA